MKYLITNADDFGFTRDVNEGIVHAHRAGILTATTLMATETAFEHAVTLSRENPALDIGVHLVLVGSEGFPPTVGALIRAIALRRIHIYDSLVQQLMKVLEAGIRPTHLDTHKHTHLLPPVLDAVSRLADAFRIPWVRRPFDLPLTGAAWKPRLISKAFTLMRGNFQRVLASRGCKTTDHFAGFQITGNYDAAELAKLIRGLPVGVTEFMCHPGFHTAELNGANTRLKESRRKELDALTSTEVREALTSSGVLLRTYRELR